MEAGLVGALLLSLLVLGDVKAQYSLDSGFGQNGRITTSIADLLSENVRAVKIDDMNRITVVYATIDTGGVARFSANGMPDASFGDEGVVQLAFPVEDLAIQADGRIVIAGTVSSTNASSSNDWKIARLMVNGTPDPSFGDAGERVVDWFAANDRPKSITLDSSGNIYVGGFAFENGVGTAIALIKLDRDGTTLQQRTDKIFSNTADFCEEILLQTDNKIICVGLARNFSGAAMIAVRYNTDFSVDMAYGENGLAQIAFGTRPTEANTAILQPDGALVLAGFVDDENASGNRNLALARLTPTGMLDMTFANDGRVEQSINAEGSESIQGIVQYQGHLYVVAIGNQLSSFMLLRFSSDGLFDGNFGNAGFAAVDFNGGVDSSTSLAIQQNAVVVGGGAFGARSSESTNLGLARLSTAGVLDSTFGDDGVSEISLVGPTAARILDAAHQADGKVIVTGYSGNTFSARNYVTARYLEDGSLDTDFGDNGIIRTDFADAGDTANALSLDADGRILVAGGVRIPPMTSDDFGIARYDSDGLLDPAFGLNGLATVDIDGDTDTARAITVQPDGKILVAGEARFPSLSFDRNFALVRLLVDGSLDTGFGTSGVANASFGDFDEGHALAIQGDGKFWLVVSAMVISPLLDLHLPVRSTTRSVTMGRSRWISLVSSTFCASCWS